jgi:squalene-hopene/tetraprenyl-beta-curcumene cyclase
MTPTCQPTSTLLADVAARSIDRARRRTSSFPAAPGRLLVRAADGRHHARIRLHSAAALAASAGWTRTASWNPPSPAASSARPSAFFRAVADGGFNIYVKGPSEISASVKAYFALKLAGLDSTTRAHAPARAHPRARRHPGGQQLHQGQSQPVRSLPARRHAQHSAGDPAAAGQAALPDVVVDAGHRIVSLAIVHAHDPKRPVPAGFNLDEIFSFPAKHHVRKQRPLAELAQDLRPVRPDSEALGEIWLRAHPQSRHSQVRTLDARAHEARRRPGRHLSADAVFRHGARCSRLSEGSSGARRSRAPVRPPDGGRRRDAVLPALFFAGLGYGDRRLRAGRSRLRKFPALAQSGADWLLAREIRRKGDWSVKRPYTEPSGWAFEFRTTGIRISTTPPW